MVNVQVPNSFGTVCGGGEVGVKIVVAWVPNPCRMDDSGRKWGPRGWSLGCFFSFEIYFFAGHS